MTLRCPACRSDSIRRSHLRSKDGVFRALLFGSYRCRNCHQRFFRLARGPWIGAAIVVLSVGAIALGWSLGSMYTSPAAESEPMISQAAEPSIDAEAPMRAVVIADDAIAALADQGDAKAQLQLGMAYRDGRAGRADPALAYQWIARSAQQGYADAQYVLGSLHLAGHGVLQSFPSAIEWFERAAQQNHADAQYNLGRLYRRGYGIAADNVRAYVWFNLAAAQGHDRAREARDSLLPLMTPEQIKAAQRESLAWRPVADAKN